MAATQICTSPIKKKTGWKVRMLSLILWFSPNGLMDGFPSRRTHSLLTDFLVGNSWALGSLPLPWRGEGAVGPARRGPEVDVRSWKSVDLKNENLVFVGADWFSYVYFQCSEFSHFMLSSAYPTTLSNSCPPKSNHKLSDLLPNLRSATLLHPP